MTVQIPKAALYVIVVLLIGGGLGVGGFFLGRESVDKNKIRQAGFDSGFAQGQSKGERMGRIAGYATGERNGINTGREQVRARFRPGGKGYRQIYNTGKDAGRAEGFRTGNQQGYSEGSKAGENSAFEGYPGGWSIGRWYIIQIAAGSDVGSDAKYAIPSRVGPMEYGKIYDLCDDGDGICGNG